MDSQWITTPEIISFKHFDAFLPRIQDDNPQGLHHSGPRFQGLEPPEKKWAPSCRILKSCHKKGNETYQRVKTEHKILRILQKLFVKINEIPANSSQFQ